MSLLKARFLSSKLYMFTHLKQMLVMGYLFPWDATHNSQSAAPISAQRHGCVGRTTCDAFVTLMILHPIARSRVHSCVCV